MTAANLGSQPRPAGTINGYIASDARWNKKHFVFDGTIRGLTLKAVGIGAKAGDTIYADFGGEPGGRAYRIIEAAHDNRAYGFWAERA